jgi:hypothetical protein
MASEITHCLIRIDFFEHPLIYPLSSDEKLLVAYCVKQAAKNNLGMFREFRGSIAAKLRLDHDMVYHFFLNNPKLIGFDPDSHLIWIKPFYELVNFGVQGEIRKKMKNRKTQVVSEQIDFKEVFKKNAFISKILSAFRDDPYLKIFQKSWMEYNFEFLSRINEQVKSVKDNRRSLDALF